VANHSLLSLLRRVLRGQAVVPELPAVQTPSSHCGCALPEGCWGSDGWHHYEATLQTLDRMARHRFAEERPGWSISELRKAYGAWWRELGISGQLDSDDTPLAWKPYLGKPMAYEPCRAYRAKVAQNLEAETAKKTPHRRGYEQPANAYLGSVERRGRATAGVNDE